MLSSSGLVGPGRFPAHQTLGSARVFYDTAHRGTRVPGSRMQLDSPALICTRSAHKHRTFMQADKSSSSSSATHADAVSSRQLGQLSMALSLARSLIHLISKIHLIRSVSAVQGRSDADPVMCACHVRPVESVCSGQPWCLWSGEYAHRGHDCIIVHIHYNGWIISALPLLQ